METSTNENKPYHDSAGKFKAGNPGGGRIAETEEQKAVRRAKKEALEKVKEEYIAKLTEALPGISPVLTNKALEGDLNAIKEINDRVMGKPQQKIDHKGEIVNQVLVKFIDAKND